MASLEGIFNKKKKGKKNLGTNLNNAGSASLPSDDSGSKHKAMRDQMLGGSDGDVDGGWVDDVERKKTVATGGKKVAELIDMNALQTADEAVAEKLFLEEQR